MNEQELVQRALIDVAQDPSSYYQGFVEDQLPLTKNISEEQFVSLFSTGDETKTKKVLQELASDKKALTSIVKRFQQKSQASMFKNGGKFDYLKKLQYGGDIVDPTYRTVINAPGDTLRTKIYKYRTDEMQTYPNGNVRYTTRDNSGDNYS